MGMAVSVDSNEEEQQDARILLQRLMALVSSMTSDDIAQLGALYDNISSAATSNFEKLNDDAKLAIISHLSDEERLRLCSTSNAMRDFCARAGFLTFPQLVAKSLESLASISEFSEEDAVSRIVLVDANAQRIVESELNYYLGHYFAYGYLVMDMANKQQVCDALSNAEENDREVLLFFSPSVRGNVPPRAHVSYHGNNDEIFYTNTGAAFTIDCEDGDIHFAFDEDTFQQSPALATAWKIELKKALQRAPQDVKSWIDDEVDIDTLLLPLTNEFAVKIAAATLTRLGILMNI